MGGRNRPTDKRVSGGDRSAAATAAAAAAAAHRAIKEACVEALGKRRSGDTEGAVNLAWNLKDRYPMFPAPLNLVGNIHEAVADEVEAALADLATKDHDDIKGFDDYSARMRANVRACRETAAGLYAKAVELAPKCAYTRASRGRALALCGHEAEGHMELISAVRINFPDSPDVANPWVLPDDSSAQEELAVFLHNCEVEVYSRSKVLLKMVRDGFAAQAKHLSSVLASKYPFSARAVMLEPYLDREIAEKSNSTSCKYYEKLVKETLCMADTFGNSLVVALFRIELMIAAGQYNSAAKACAKALDMKSPDDPLFQEIPPGDRTSGVERRRDARVKCFTDRLKELMVQSQLSLKYDIHQVDNSSAKKQGHKKPNLMKVTPKNRRPKLKLYTDSEDMDIDDSALNTKKADTPVIIREEQIMGDTVVPLNVVDAYADYCRYRDTCPKGNVVCHFCVIELGEERRYHFRRGNLIWHSRKHQKGSTVQCDEKGCETRLCTQEDIDRHKFYCHEFRAGWWKNWPPLHKN
ncbi:uncharacterized protein LOC119299341 [Triticum dicoccoides]|uniref:uncharacterized protein LOC119299341 n=1 Tax=Triticum dicoccoides TaxID=85692 RepID=UPI0018902620|nr:uncharacterized protein LOC119299341 [Triticum dicoccoides]